ncbi:MAG: lipoyl(octanoyl) transferase LipB [Dehalococcoidia bacterium]|nr:lipoyl(octanoyl) transferase LipB [Dehalococcoidia bacterium]
MPHPPIAHAGAARHGGVASPLGIQWPSTFSEVLFLTSSHCVAAYLGRVEYGRALELQRRLVEQRKAGHISDRLLLLEHPHVITLGRRGSEEEILAPPASLKEQGIAVYRVERGGLVTYHGPGQLMGYPILDLRPWGGPVDYVHALEEVLICTVALFGVPGQRVAGHPGVWVEGVKLASIGVHVSGGVTSHGFALNVHTNLEMFSAIVPCGVPGLQFTSLERLTGLSLSLEEVARQVARDLAAVFRVEVSWQPPGVLVITEGEGPTPEGEDASSPRRPAAATLAL